MGAPTVAGGVQVDAENIPTQRQLTRRHFDEVLPTFLDSLSENERVAFLDNGSKCGTAWLHVHPYMSGHRVLSDRQVSAALNVRTLQSDVLGRNTCSQCTAPQGTLHFEACPNGQSQSANTLRHNSVRDILISALKTNNRRVLPEPPINNNNLQRADISVSSAEGVHVLDATYGLLDVTIKAPLCVDTAAVRGRVVEGLEEEGDQRQCGWLQLAASLEVAATQKRNHYSGLAPSQTVVPIVISSGGTLHKEAYKFFMDMFPDAEVRSNLYADISIALVRGRASAYCLE